MKYIYLFLLVSISINAYSETQSLCQLGLTFRETNHCFVKGHLVSTSVGKVCISEIVPGDEVYSYNVSKGTWVIDVVTDVYEFHDVMIYQLTLENNQVFNTTGTSPFYSADKKRFIPVSELKSNDRLYRKDGSSLKISKIEKLETRDTVYNLKTKYHQNYLIDGLLVKSLGN